MRFGAVSRRLYFCLLLHPSLWPCLCPSVLMWPSWYFWAQVRFQLKNHPTLKDLDLESFPPSDSGVLAWKAADCVCKWLGTQIEEHFKKCHWNLQVDRWGHQRQSVRLQIQADVWQDRAMGQSLFLSVLPTVSGHTTTCQLWAPNDSFYAWEREHELWQAEMLLKGIKLWGWFVFVLQ